MIIFLIFCIIIKTVFTNQLKNWIPKYQSESTFDEPYDFVNVDLLPNLEKYGKNYDWISISGTSLSTSSYIAFTGTRNNNASSYKAVFRKQSGIIILCSSVSNSSNKNLGFDLNCKTLSEKSLETSDGKYFGAVVKSTKFKNDTVAFIYCDPLWFDPKYPLKISNGKCQLTLVKDYSDMKHIEYQVCDKFKKCLGGFSVDLIAIDNDLKILFGLPFENSTKLSNLVGSQEIKDGPEKKGTYFNYGYSVAFSGDGSQFASSPVNDGYSPFVKMMNIETFYPTDISTQRYGGFGTSMDTVSVGNNLYGVIIGSPYQSKPNLVNVGAVFLACKGKNSTDVIFGENANDYFGYSVARLGDIDSNGPEEFIVSAPSLNFEKPGKIYIFSTTRHCKISKNPLQVYQSNINGFGIAISRGFDINFNGKPDFFVTALGYQKPFLFIMPNQGKVTCSWIEQNKGDFITKENFKIKVIFQSSNINHYGDYYYQVAIDFLNKGEPRFKLNDTILNDDGYTMTLQPLLDVQDMDFKTVPLKVAIKGIRKCKVSGVQDCYLSKTAQIEWLKCEETVKLSQKSCSKINCKSELSIKSVKNSKEPVIYHGEKSDYQRKIELLITNNGPDFTQRVFVTINSEPDIRIDNVNCDGTCKFEHKTTQHTNIIVKDSLEKKDDFKISIDVLYNELETVNERTSINFKIWSINDDDIINNNNFTLLYTVLFKPKLIISSKNTKENNIDSRIKPPYLGRLNRVSVQDLGTELSFSYLIKNNGPELKNVELKLLFPYKITSDKYILYLMEKIRLSSDESWENVMPSINNKTGLVKYCHVAKDMLNPLNVIGHKYNKKSDNLSRLKRSLETNILNNLTTQNQQSNLDVNNNFFSSSRTSNIKCNESIRNLGYPLCGEVTCNLNLIPKNSEFTFDFQAWLFTKTFFDAHIPHLTILTTLEATLRDLPKGLKILKEDQFIGPIVASQNILFNKMKVDEDKPLPLWPIIVAIIIGIFLLVIIIVIAYYCGFFKRKRLRKERQKIRERATKIEETMDSVPLNPN